MERTTCLVVGGGPAGMVLALLLARAGVEVTVLEKHGDFLRDFRGDTVHPSTVRLIDELGLGPEFRELPQSRLDKIRLPDPAGGTAIIGDLSRLPSPYNYVAMVPQWDFLNLMARAAEREPTFTLRMHTEATGLIREAGKVAGVRYRTHDGQHGEIRADLTVGCDGRQSTLRAEAGLRPKNFDVPFDTWWCRVPRPKGDDTETSGIAARIKDHRLMLTINRGDYFQVAYFQRKGTDAELRAEGVAAFRNRLANLMPELAGEIQTIKEMDEVKVLDVRLDRLHHWHTDGLLLIGDAAHAMSPVGGVGINLAVQDAVATATLLAKPLLRHQVRPADLAKVRRRRWPAMVLVQGLQRILHGAVLGPVLRGERDTFPKGPASLLRRFPQLRIVPAYLVGIGPRPEHAPEFARRAPQPIE